MFEFSFNDACRAEKEERLCEIKSANHLLRLKFFQFLQKKANSLVFDNVSKVQQRGKRFHRLII